MLMLWFGLVGLWCFRLFQQYFSYIVAISFIVGGNQSTRRKPPTCHASHAYAQSYEKCTKVCQKYLATKIFHYRHIIHLKKKNSKKIPISNFLINFHEILANERRIKCSLQYFSYIVAISFIVGGNQSTRRKPPTCHASHAYAMIL
jgi:hypothetical protein